MTIEKNGKKAEKHKKTTFRQGFGAYAGTSMNGNLLTVGIFGASIVVLNF
jgi:hypothetical protein